MNTENDVDGNSGSPPCYADAYWAMIAAQGKVPDDLRILWMTESQVEHALFRVEPLQFMGDGRVKCIHPDEFKRFDGLLSA